MKIIIVAQDDSSAPGRVYEIQVFLSRLNPFVYIDNRVADNLLQLWGSEMQVAVATFCCARYLKH